jgi:hypothetical protein
VLDATHDTLLEAAPVSKKKTVKKKMSHKKNVVPSDHLLEPEHDMLLPPTTEDTTP